MPDFTQKYAAHRIERLKASGASAQAIERGVRDMQRFDELYRNPFINVAMTFLEPFPIGLGITLISAAVLRKK